MIKLNEAYRATSQSTSGTTNDSCVLDESVADTQAICSSVKMREFPAGNLCSADIMISEKKYVYSSLSQTSMP